MQHIIENLHLDDTLNKPHPPKKQKKFKTSNPMKHSGKNFCKIFHTKSKHPFLQYKVT